MISRRTSLRLAEAVEGTFFRIPGGATRYQRPLADGERLYDFLYAREFEAGFCNAARVLHNGDTRGLKEFIMQIHTGETLTRSGYAFASTEFDAHSQILLHRLAEAMLNYLTKELVGDGQHVRDTHVRILRAQLESDGYVYSGDRLIGPDEGAIDAPKEVGVLEQQYADLALRDGATTFSHLRLAEEHWLAGRWRDTISNARSVLESILREVAARQCLASSGNPLADDVRRWPVKVRDYLQKQGLFTASEMELISKTYGLLSETGGHPHIAEKDEARLMRYMALVLSQFAMLKLRGWLDSQGGPQGPAVPPSMSSP